MTSHPDTILIIDFGSQVTQLIARRVRETGVYSEVVPFQSAAEAFGRIKPKGVILSGGPASTHEAGSPRAPQEVFEAGIPVLGICYGQMTMCVQMGGVAEGSDHREFGRAYVQIEKDCPLFDGLWMPGQRHQVWMSHGDRVIALPEGFEIFGKSEGAPFAIFGSVARKMYGVMFHPKLCIRRTAQDCSPISCTRSSVWRPTGRCRPIARRWSKRSAAGRQRQGDLRAVGRRGLLGRRAADPRGGG
jgi:GMP synthase (glutamine-hydrolysing)